MSFGLPEKLAVALAAAALLANCATNPVTGRPDFVMMSEEQELALGRKADGEVRKEYGVYKDSGLQSYVGRIGGRLAAGSHRPAISYHFAVVDSGEVNAFALPGGYIYVTRGILPYLESEAELAAVVGHEIGHVTARHGVRQYSASMAAGLGAAVVGAVVPQVGQVAQSVLDVLSNAILSGYGREHELEADRLGAEYLARAGYDPQAMIQVIRVLKDQELFDAEIARQEGREPRRYHGLFATHPDNDTRLMEVVGEATRLARPGAAQVRGRDEYLRQLDGLVFGDSPEQGMVRGNEFYHPALGFAVRFPPGWRLKNHAERVQAASPAGDALMELRLLEKARGTPAELLRRRLQLSPGTEMDTTPISGLPAAATTFQRSGRPIAVAAVFLGENAFLIAGTTRQAAAFNRHAPDIRGAIRSFHPITDAERKLAEPLRIRLVKPKKGDTFASLAQGSPLGRNAEGYLRLINGAYPKGEPAPGQTLKVVE
jgi:predicted Zn-dependent protease